MSIDSSVQKSKSPMKLVLEPIKGRLIIASLLAAIGIMLTLVPLVGIAYIAQVILGGLSTEQIWQVVTWSLVSLFAGLIINTFAEYYVHCADNRLTHHLRLSAIERLSLVPLGWFTGRASGDVKQAMQDDIGALHDLTAHFFTTIARAVAVVVFSAIYLFAMSWQLALVTCVPFIAFFWLYSKAFKAGGEFMGDFIGGMARIDNAVVEFVSGIPVVKTFGVSGKSHSSYRDAVDAFAVAFRNLIGSTTKSVSAANAIMNPVTVLGFILTFGMIFIALGWIQPMDIVPFALIAPGICAPMLMISFITHGLRNATGSAERLNNLLHTPILEQPASLVDHPKNSIVKFENVDYGYDSEHLVVKNFDLTLKPGTVTAIVGASGAGKSTIARLLLRFFDPVQGKITLGDVDLKAFPSQALYQRIGFVLQEVRLINASVRENIALASPNATQDEVEAAAKAANIHHRIMSLPKGYDSIVGEDAILSGGEQQRVSIARAILLDPSILVLDEATAAADADNEAVIQEALSRFAVGRTLLVIAHRLDTIMHADHIVVMDEGQIVEQGTHVQLLERQGRYASLWQQGKYGQSDEEASEVNHV
ncbi:ABC transporter ATP-binding protein [Wohlfahrtiimonas larvae]|uniref:ABC transporter ATP-binding protein n=1 Tax=Wohlfahrtiimonas larvae TaxID=1157986 RepID=A0ABP9MM86_9GAMM|nr:ABC transporter ATP-binding protein [Wohlfahrtiimonas larvae]